MTAEELAQFFDDAKSTRTGHMAKCPSHEDRVRSLSIDPGDDGGVVLKCHAGCDTGAVLAAKGIPWSEVFADESTPLRGSQASQLVESYIYRDENGIPVSKKDRFHPKGFRQSHYDLETDQWVMGMNGTPSTLFNLPELLAAKRDRAVFFVEGEKAAKALEGIGLVATAPGGATAWKHEFVEHFKGARKVIALPDNDEPGKKMVEGAVADLLKANIDVQVVDLPGLPPKGDVFDWIKAGGTRERLTHLVSSSAPGGIRIWRGSELAAVMPSPTKFIIGGAVPEGLVLLVGAPKTGKSLIALEMANAVARGTKAMNHLLATQGNALVFPLEDGISLTKERIGEMYGDFPEALCLSADGPGSILHNGWKNVDRALDSIGGARMIVIDTLAKVKGDQPGQKGGNAYFDDAKMCHAMNEWALRHGLALVVIHHDRKMKSGEDGDPLDDISGSKGLTAAATGVIMFRRKRFQDQGKLQVVGRTLADREYQVERMQSNRWVITDVQG